MSKREVERQDRKVRERTAVLTGYVEDVFYAAVALALLVAGVILFGSVVYSFIDSVGDGPLSDTILEFLDGLLLVFIVTELINTVGATIRAGVLITEPFLIVGVVAAIRRLIVISAEAKDLLGKPEFADAMTEIAILAVTILLLGISIFLLRRTTHSEPAPDYDSDF